MPGSGFLVSKKISVPVATAVALGAIIGAGIFVLSGTAIALAGAYALIAFVFVGIVAALIAFQLGELGSIMPKAKGAAYSFVYEAFGSQLGFITGILLYFSFATAIAAVALGFGSYAASFLGLGSGYSIYIAMVLIFVLSLVNIYGIKKAAKMDFGLVVVKISILAIFVAFAAVFAFSGGGHFSFSYLTTPASKAGLAAIFAASVAIFFAYSGFQAISTFTSEVEGGANKAARAIIYSVIISIVVYVLVVLALMLLVPVAKYTVSADPLAFALSYIHAPIIPTIIVSFEKFFLYWAFFVNLDYRVINDNQRYYNHDAYHERLFRHPYHERHYCYYGYYWHIRVKWGFEASGSFYAPEMYHGKA